MVKSSGFVVAAALVVLLASVGGCSRQIVVLHYPDFNVEPIQKVAVVPFANETFRPRAGEVVAGRLAEALRANGTYEVLGPRELARTFSAQQLEGFSKQSAEVVARQLAPAGVQAVITGTVRSFGVGPTRVAVVRDYYWDYYPGWRHYWGYGGPYYGGPYYWGDAYYESSRQVWVEAQSSLIRSPDGQVIRSAGPVQAGSYWQGEGMPPAAGTSLDFAVARLVHMLVFDYAVVPIPLKIPSDSLATARPSSSAIDAGWVEDDSFSSADPTMAVLISLPPQADRNSFTLTISRRGDYKPANKPAGERQLAGHVYTGPPDRRGASAPASGPADLHGRGPRLAQPELVGPPAVAQDLFTWSQKDATVHFTFSPKDIAAAHGPGDYQANLFYDGQVAAIHKFKIEK